MTSAHEAIARLEEALPGLKGCAMVVALSSKGRVLQHDKPVAASPNFHAWVQVADPDLTDQFRLRLKPRLAAAGLGWMKPKGDKMGPAALIDTSVWAISRCVYVGAPNVGPGLTLAPANVRVTEGGRFTLASLPEPTEAERAAMRDAFGIEFREGGGASFRDATGQLTGDTPLEVQGHKPMTLAEFMANDAFVPDVKYRCQTPFRASTSWNGILRKYKSGRATVYDNGTEVLYAWPDPLAGFDVEGESEAEAEGDDRQAASDDGGGCEAELKWLLENAPPVLKAYTDWHQENALRPHPVFALVSGLLFIQSVVGRGVCLPRGLRANLWLLVLAPTESGKGDVPRLATMALAQLRAAKTVPAVSQFEEAFASAEGLWWHLESNPVAIWVDEELAKTLAAIIAATEGTPRYAMKRTLLRLSMPPPRGWSRPCVIRSERDRQTTCTRCTIPSWASPALACLATSGASPPQRRTTAC